MPEHWSTLFVTEHLLSGSPPLSAQVSPAGSTSWFGGFVPTPVAVPGPWFVHVIVNVAVSPALMLLSGSSGVFCTETSGQRTNRWPGSLSCGLLSASASASSLGSAVSEPLSSLMPLPVSPAQSAGGVAPLANPTTPPLRGGGGGLAV